MQSHWLIFGNRLLNYQSPSQKALPKCTTWSYLLWSWSRSWLDWDLVFVQGERQGSSFTLPQMSMPSFEHHLWRRLSFLQCMFLAPFGGKWKQVAFLVRVCFWLFSFFGTCVSVLVAYWFSPVACDLKLMLWHLCCSSHFIITWLLGVFLLVFSLRSLCFLCFLFSVVCHYP